MDSFLPTANDSRTIRQLTAFVHGGFILAGAVTILLGPILPMLATRWSLKDSQTGRFFLAQFLGAIFGAIVSSYAIPRSGFRISFMSSFFLVAIGVATLGQGQWVLSLLSISVYGTGLGFLSATTNLWTGEARQPDRAGALNLVNFSWTAGAMVCPFLVALFTARSHLTGLLWAFAGASGFLAIACVFLPLDQSLTALNQSDKPKIKNVTIPQNRNIFLFGAVFFLWVGTENAIGGWLATYSHRILISTSNAWIITPSLFWGGLMLGRAFAPMALKRISELRVIQSGVLVGIAGIIILMGASTFRGIASGTVVAGFGFSAVFPVLMSWVVEYYGIAARRIGGQMLGLGILGGAVLPWLIGYLSTRFGSLKEGLAIVFVTLIATLILFSLLPRSPADATNIF